jgi:hypothetical protein
MKSHMKGGAISCRVSLKEAGGLRVLDRLDEECDISVSHLYKWALRMMQGCVLVHHKVNLRGTKKHHDTTMRER